MRKNMFNTMESEERTIRLEGMCKLGLSTREVISFMTKQRFAKRFRDPTKTGTLLMGGKLKDSREESNKLRGERRVLRSELEEILGKNNHKCKRIITKLKDKVKTKRKEIKLKNQEKINRYKDRKKSDDIQKSKSNLPEACKQFEI